MTGLTDDEREALYGAGEHGQFFCDCDDAMVSNSPSQIWSGNGPPSALLGRILADRLAAHEARQARVRALADEWERSDDRTWISNCGGELRAELDSEVTDA